MSSNPISWEIEDRQVNTALERFAGLRPGSHDWMGLMNDIGRAQVTSTKLGFRDQRDPDGTPWIPSKRAKETGGQTLRLSSILANSFDHLATMEGVEWGTSVRHASTHQYGRMEPEQVAAHVRTVRQVFGRRLATPVKANVKAHTKNPNIPARRFLGFSLIDQEDILDLVDGRIMRLARPGPEN